MCVKEKVNEGKRKKQLSHGLQYTVVFLANEKERESEGSDTVGEVEGESKREEEREERRKRKQD